MAYERLGLEGEPVVVVGTAQWTAPWLTEQILAFALADRHPVVYVEPPQIKPLRRGGDGVPRLRRERLHGREIVVFRPVVLPLRSRTASARASAPFYRAQLRTLMRQLGLADVILIAGDARPGLVGAAGERLSSYIVKDWVDEDANLLGRTSAELIAERDAICAQVDVVLAISPNLQDSLARAGVRSSLLRHGFHADLAAEYERDPPPDLAALPAPRIVFSGRIDGRLDVGKLRAVARRFPDGSVVLIGPTSPRMGAGDLAALHAEANIHLLGARPRSALPPYLAHADCLLMPYRDTVWLRHASPLKLWDYLYAGPRIVGSGCPILSEYDSLLSFTDRCDAFVDAVARSIEDRGGAAERRAFALANTWDHRARQLEVILAAAARREGG